MPYNTSRNVVEKNKKLLDEMLESKATIRKQVRNSRSYAYKVREVLAAVQVYEDYKEMYGELKNLYVVKEINRFTIELRYIGNILKIKNVKKEQEIKAEITEQRKLDTPPDQIQFEGVRDLLEVIGVALKLDATHDEIFFPDANLQEPDKLRLYQWCKLKNWNYIDHEGAGLTLTRKPIEDEFILWEPPV